MKNTKAIFTLLVLLFVFACNKGKPTPPAETPVMKEVEYRIFAAREYSEPIFNGISVDLRLQVRIINYKTGDMNLIWDSTLSTRKLTDFPQADQPILIKRIVPVLNSHQKLNGSYSVRYNEGNRINQEGSSDEAGPGTNSVLLQAVL